MAGSSKKMQIQKITPFLWFDNNAEEAVNFYLTIFKDARIESITRYGEGGPGPEGSVMLVEFELEGQSFQALNGGPVYQLTPAISFVVSCETQQEVDYLWEKLTDGGQEIECGWLCDKYGLSWQIVPEVFMQMIKDENAAKAQSVMKAMLQMKKFDIPTLQEAYERG